MNHDQSIAIWSEKLTSKNDGSSIQRVAAVHFSSPYDAMTNKKPRDHWKKRHSCTH